MVTEWVPVSVVFRTSAESCQKRVKATEARALVVFGNNQGTRIEVVSRRLFLSLLGNIVF